VSENLDMLLKTGEAYRYAEAMHDTS